MFVLLIRLFEMGETMPSHLSETAVMDVTAKLVSMDTHISSHGHMYSYGI